MSIYQKTTVCALCLLSSLLVGCGPVDDRVEISEERVLPSDHDAPLLGKSLRERMMPQARMSPGSVEPDGGEVQVQAEDLLAWDVPEGWTQVAPRGMMRLINLRFGEGEVGECYLTILPGAGGGLPANVGRWYRQMGMEPPSEAEVAALPAASLMGRTGVAVDIEGTFTGMGAPPLPNARLIGRMLAPQASGENSFSMTIKMTGPAEMVAANLEKFEQFCDSLKPGARTGGAPDGGDGDDGPDADGGGATEETGG